MWSTAVRYDAGHPSEATGAKQTGITGRSLVHRSHRSGGTRDQAHDIDRIKALLGAGVDVNEADDDNEETALIHAMTGLRDPSDTIRVLIAAKADVDQYQHTGGVTALTEAASKGWNDAARVLIEAGADQYLRDQDSGWSALLYAINMQDLEMVEILLEGDADVNLVDGEQLSPLWHAIDPDITQETPSGLISIPIVTLLIDAKADVDFYIDHASFGSTLDSLGHLACSDKDDPNTMDAMKILIAAGASSFTRRGEG